MWLAQGPFKVEGGADNTEVFLLCHPIYLQSYILNVCSHCILNCFSLHFSAFSGFFQRHIHSLLPSSIPPKKSSESAFILGSPTFSMATSVVSAVQFHRYFSYTHTHIY